MEVEKKELDDEKEEDSKEAVAKDSPEKVSPKKSEDAATTSETSPDTKVGFLFARTCFLK
jgi:hypothetical protein